MSNGNGTQVAVEFEDWSERPLASREDLRKEIRQLEVLLDGYRYEITQVRQTLSRVQGNELTQKKRAHAAEEEAFRLHRRLERIPSRVRSFFDWIHKIRRAWQYVTSQA